MSGLFAAVTATAGLRFAPAPELKRLQPRVDYTIGQWADYTNISDVAFLTSISNDMSNLFTSQSAQTMDNLMRVNL